MAWGNASGGKLVQWRGTNTFTSQVDYRKGLDMISSAHHNQGYGQEGLLMHPNAIQNA
jgi:hypothetical protein